MKHFFKALIYFIFTPVILWFGCILFSILVSFSYSDNILSWIPYIILGAWVPGKFYGLTLLHLIFCVSISFSVINFFDNRLELNDKTRRILLIFIIILFLYESISNFFFRAGLQVEIAEFRQWALLQFSFGIGVLIKTINKNVEMN